MLTAAVRSGADAVYLGLRDFNARRNADNFGMTELGEAVKYCHIRGVRVYLALNTVLSDDEIKRAVSVAADAYRLGVDAVIVQDLGLAGELHRALPELPLHASTQLTAHSPSALPILKKLGFTQVVASREMSEKELAEFCAAARELSMTVEVFVHGALCMCMSGQCYMSAMLGGRSGNRGLCAGPCRLPFAAPGGLGYDLSLKDLSLVDCIDRLRALGVSSLKIEGRMKRPEYVAAATAACKNAAEGLPCGELCDTLYKVFSRSGFTKGYFEGKLGPDMFGVRTKDDVEMSASVMKSLHELYRGERQSVPVCGEFFATVGEPMRLSVSDGEHSITAEGAEVEPARTTATARDRVISQLEKTGGTPFYFEKLDVDLSENSAVSAGALNALRRDALERLSQLRAAERNPVSVSVETPEKCSVSEKIFLVARFADEGQIPDNIEGVSLVVLPLESAFERVKISLPIAVDIPRGIESENYIRSRLETAKKAGVRAAFCGNIAAVELALEAGLLPVFDFSMNLFNSHSCLSAEKLGSVANVLSFEMTCEQINAVSSPVPKGIVAYGRLPLMLTRNCPLKNGRNCGECDKKGGLTDRKNIFFPVRCRAGYSEIFNSRPLWLSERMDEFSVDFAVLYFTFESAEECGEIIKAYINKTKAQGEYTRGLYYRGVE